MILTILRRYVFLELVRVFLLALFALTAILTLGLVVHEAAQQGLGPAAIVRLVPLLIPSTLPITIPTTTLFAVAVVFGRMAHDQELTAVRAAGIPLTYVLFPALLLGAILSVVVFFLYEEVIPRATNAFKNAVVQDIEELLYSRLRRDLQFQQPGVHYAIFIKEVQGRRLLGTTFKKRDQWGNDELVAQAHEAEIQVDVKSGEVLVRMRHGDITRADQSNASFDYIEFAVPFPTQIQKNRLVRAREMTNAQILTTAREIDAELAEIARKITAQFGHFRHDKQLAETNPTNSHYEMVLRRKREMKTEYASRPAVAAGCFFFVLIGCPVAVWFHRRDYLSAFVTCFLPIIIIYYPLIMFAMNLSKEGQLDPTYGLWIGDAVLGIVGVVLLHRLLRH